MPSAWSAAAKEKGINTTVVIPGVSVYGPSALMINKYNTAKADLAKLLLDFVLADEAQTAFAEFGARPIRYVLGDLELPMTAKTTWLPDADYAGRQAGPGLVRVDAKTSPRHGTPRFWMASTRISRDSTGHGPRRSGVARARRPALADTDS